AELTQRGNRGLFNGGNVVHEPVLACRDDGVQRRLADHERVRKNVQRGLERLVRRAHAMLGRPDLGRRSCCTCQSIGNTVTLTPSGPTWLLPADLIAWKRARA